MRGVSCFGKCGCPCSQRSASVLLGSGTCIVKHCSRACAAGTLRLPSHAMEDDFSHACTDGASRSVGGRQAGRGQHASKRRRPLRYALHEPAASLMACWSASFASQRSSCTAHSPIVPSLSGVLCRKKNTRLVLSRIKYESLTRLTAVGIVLTTLMSRGIGTADALHCSLEVCFSSDGAADAVPRSMLPSTLKSAAILCLCVLDDHLLGFQRLMPGSGPVFCLGAFDAGQAPLHSIQSVQFPCSEITVLHLACKQAKVGPTLYTLLCFWSGVHIWQCTRSALMC